jgi:hypothetical protein
VSYFIEATTRLANDSYFTRLIDIIRKPEAAPLLTALSESEDALLAVFSLETGSGTASLREFMQPVNRKSGI